MQEAFAGRRQAPMPEGWPELAEKLAQGASEEIREKTMLLSLLFGVPDAEARARKIVQDVKAASGTREELLQALVSKKDSGLVPLLQGLIVDPALGGPALRALAAIPDETTPKVILDHFSSFNEKEKSDAIDTLTSRPAYASALLDAIERGQVARRELSAFNARQMTALQQKDINERLAKVWGTVGATSREKATRLTKYKTLLTSAYLRTADLSHGRLVFSRTCASCHRLFDDGGAIGPELTGSQRANLDYVLENLLDPSAIVPFDYRVTILETKDGRFLSGIIKQENDRTVTVQTQNDAVIIPKNEIESRNLSSLSLMPEGLIDKMTKEDLRDLVAYLASPRQAPLAQPQTGRK
jgi:putative heme-binding domain-containing protein